MKSFCIYIPNPPADPANPNQKFPGITADQDGDTLDALLPRAQALANQLGRPVDITRARIPGRNIRDVVLTVRPAPAP